MVATSLVDLNLIDCALLYFSGKIPRSQMYNKMEHYTDMQ